MSVVLWQIELSHYNEKVRWALDYKGIPHERRTPVPGLHGFTAARVTRGKQRRLPVIDLDGTTIGDSTAIIGALEEYRPNPPLYPHDPAERVRALELEDHFDEQLGPHVRRFGFHHTLQDDDALIGSVLTGDNPGRERLLRASLPIAKRVIRLDYDVSDESVAQALSSIRAAMDRVEAELDGGEYLVGGEFSVADLTAAVLFTPVLSPTGRQYQPRNSPRAVLDLREELEARPGGEWVEKMFARHRGRSAELAMT